MLELGPDAYLKRTIGRFPDAGDYGPIFVVILPPSSLAPDGNQLSLFIVPQP
jgi:hypothetical protein